LASKLMLLKEEN